MELASYFVATDLGNEIWKGEVHFVLETLEVWLLLVLQTEAVLGLSGWQTWVVDSLLSVLQMAVAKVLVGRVYGSEPDLFALQIDLGEVPLVPQNDQGLDL